MTSSLILPKSCLMRESLYLVLKKVKWNGRKYHPGETIKLPAWAVDYFYYAGVVTDDFKVVNGKPVHPLDQRYPNEDKN